MRTCAPGYMAPSPAREVVAPLGAPLRERRRMLRRGAADVERRNNRAAFWGALSAVRRRGRAEDHTFRRIVRKIRSAHGPLRERASSTKQAAGQLLTP